MLLSYFIIFILGGTIGFVIACILAADRTVYERSKATIKEINRFDQFS